MAAMSENRPLTSSMASSRMMSWKSGTSVPSMSAPASVPNLIFSTDWPAISSIR